MRFGERGKWWVTRKDVALESDGTLTVMFATSVKAYGDKDGKGWVRLNGTPDTLRNVARAIESQILSAELNTDEEVAR